MDSRKEKKIREASKKATAGATGIRDSALAMRMCDRQTEGHCSGYEGMRKREELRMAPSFLVEQLGKMRKEQV